MNQPTKSDTVQKAIEVANLKKHYGDVKAVDGISFHVRTAQVFTLLGPNGAGKTTTVEILEGLKDPDSGEMRILGEPCQRVTPKMKDRMGVLLQESRFIEKVKVKELLQMFATFFSRSIKVDEVMEMVALTEKAQAFTEGLSGGQRQRLAIGLALLNNPEIIFLDEPTTGLDPQARRNIWDLINRLRAEKKTIFLTTHYMEEAERLSDYVYIMDHGKIIAHGTPQELINQIGKENVIEFEKGDLSEDVLEQIKARFSRVSIQNDKVFLYEEDLTSALSALLEWAKQSSVEMKNLTFRQPNLEDVFLTLTGKGLRD